MITARNYAAQAERDLRIGAESLKRNGMSVDALIFDAHANLLRDSVKFVIPDGGTIFDDDLRGLKGIEFNLPYNSIAIEYFIPDGGASCGDGIETPFGRGDASIEVKKRIALADIVPFSMLELIAQRPIKEILAPMFWENGENECVSIKYLDFSEFIKMWTLGHAQCFIPKTTLINSYRREYVSSVAPLLPDMCEMMIGAYGEKQYIANALQDVSSQVRVVFELCEALTCTNVESAIHQAASAKVNAKRIKAGKLPIYETRVLTVKPTREAGESRGPLGYDRNGPRQHLRRGHVRRLPTGKNTWIQSCVVGSLKNGLIHKSYEIRP